MRAAVPDPVLPGPVIAVGGNEDTAGACAVLGTVARYAGAGPLAVVTAASGAPEARWAAYAEAFGRLGVREVRHVDVRGPEDAFGPGPLAALGGAAAVFLAGGDQFRLLARVAGTPVHARIAALNAAGAAVAGTSAGAAACGERVIGWDHRAAGERGALAAAPGLGLLRGTIVDQHCTERGRVSRLVAAVRAAPALLGLGVDEDTAVVHDGTGWLRVVGRGSVYVVRAASVAADGPVRLDVLAAGDEFDLTRRRAAALGRRRGATRPGDAR